MKTIIVTLVVLASATGLICRAVGSMQSEQTAYASRIDSRIAQETR